MPSPVPETYFRYLPASPVDRNWELFVTTAGYDCVPKGPAGYKPIMPLHPPDYRFAWTSGRVLRECQIIYTLRGTGTFESADGGQRAIRGGDAFLIFPGQWHRYRPDADSGWDEYWVGLDGAYVRRLLRKGFFSPRDPVFHPGQEPVWGSLFTSLIETIRLDPVGCQQVAGSIAFQLFARLGVLARLQKEPGPVQETLALILRAKTMIAAHLERELDGKALAEELGMGYSRFRHCFAQYTGFSPGQYHQQMRVARAKHLLSGTARNVKEVAAELGMDPYYFSHLFKRKTGESPETWRTKFRPTKSRPTAL